MEYKLEKPEGHKVKAMFFLIGLLLTLPSHVIVNISFLINNIYNEQIFVTVMGILSGCMIVASAFQLLIEITSFTSILVSNAINIINMGLLLIFICVCKTSKYYIYGICAIIGLFIGYLYSACTKYSLLLDLKVNGFLVTGISFSALFVFTINTIISYFIIEDGNIESYYNTIFRSFIAILIIECCILLGIFYIQYNSIYFQDQKKKIEFPAYKYASKSLNDVEKGKKNMNSNNNYGHSGNTSFLKSFKSLFNFSNIIDGARLIKHYYTCLIPISFTILITFIIYPHIIPNGLDKNVSTNYMLMLMYQASDFIFIFLVTVNEHAFKFVKQIYVLIVCLSRVLLVVLSLKIMNSKEGDFIYTTGFITFVVILLGMTNGSLINMSYERINDCFRNSNNKEKKVAVASSFCALSLLTSYALAPWICHVVMHL
ncbi:nucleoside transporter 4, putative [Plasmodium chabaudi chabaudi]|uniref:Nucleoside transporter 4, putative n=1 Tax=Plasmodium chabaudi chabaudi TaxID=31271 RepID=A0A1C6X245_PLACU|nr:nucleoside transporter 4, putative [Plasmodium chabaudi chabaudi]SCL96714.1 nucleoside transporter 4, putative [Plasmodium chabaudi chabaudi]